MDVEIDGDGCLVGVDSAGDGCLVVDHLLALAVSDRAGDGCFAKRSMGWRGISAGADDDAVVSISETVAFPQISIQSHGKTMRMFMCTY